MLTPQISLEEKYDTPSLKSQFQDILDNFSFANLATVMASPCKAVWNDDYTKILGYEPWTLYVDKKVKVPTKTELYNIATNLLSEVMNYIENHPNEVFYSIFTGPFKVTYRWGILELNAVLESWSGD